MVLLSLTQLISQPAINLATIHFGCFASTDLSFSLTLQRPVPEARRLAADSVSCVPPCMVARARGQCSDGGPPAARPQMMEAEKAQLERYFTWDGDSVRLEHLNGRRKSKKTYEYEVKWYGKRDSKNSWITREQCAPPPPPPPPPWVTSCT